MQLVFSCPSCRRRVRVDVFDSSDSIWCIDCDWARAISASDSADDSPVRCLVCGCNDLWRQKDFPRKLGLAVVGLGILLSSIAYYYYRPTLAIGILMALALVDSLLYILMRDLLVCYRCGARYRHARMDEDHPRFNLETAERYRQEALRLDNSRKPKA